MAMRNAQAQTQHFFTTKGQAEAFAKALQAKGWATVLGPVATRRRARSWPVEAWRNSPGTSPVRPGYGASVEGRLQWLESRVGELITSNELARLKSEADEIAWRIEDEYADGQTQEDEK